MLSHHQSLHVHNDTDSYDTAQSPAPAAARSVRLLLPAPAEEEYETSFTYHKGTGILEIDRTYCGVTKDVVCVRKIKIADPKGLKKMRFILDRQSIELFINDGQQVATTAVCTPLEAQGIRFFSDKKMYITVEKYDIVL